MSAVPPKSWFTLRNASPDTLVVEIFEEIGFWGISAKQFAAQLKGSGLPKNITLRLDCPGGDCNDGFTIYDALVATGAAITVEIVGLAASMASVIMLAAQKIKIAENGRVMIHRVTAGAAGNADELDAAAKVAKQFEDRIVSLYVARTQQPEDQIREWMKANQGTWFFGQAAVEAGFADELLKGTPAQAFNRRWTSLFTMLPAALFDTPPSPSPSAPHPPLMKDKLLKACKALNLTLKGDETEEQLVDLIAAHQPEPAVPVEIVKEDDKDGKTDPAALVAKALKPLEAKLTALEDDNTKLRALITGGAAAAANGGKPVRAKGEGEGEAKTLSRAEFAALNAHARAGFLKSGGMLTE